MRGGISIYYTCWASVVRQFVIFSRPERQLQKASSLLTGIGYVIVLKIILRQLLVLDHAKLNRFQHFSVIVELVVSETDLFETLGDRGTEEHTADAFVSQEVATEIDFFEG